MNENGAKAQKAVNLWLQENWLLLLVVAGVITWGVRMEGQTGDRYTGTEAARDKAEIIQILHEDITTMKDDIGDIKSDVSYLRGQHDKQQGED
jgi:hypothetical protein